MELLSSIFESQFPNKQNDSDSDKIQFKIIRKELIPSVTYLYSRGTKVGDMLTLAPERYTAGSCMVTKVIP